MTDVVLDGAFREVQAFGDRAVAEALGDAAGDLGLAG